MADPIVIGETVEYIEPDILFKGIIMWYKEVLKPYMDQIDTSLPEKDFDMIVDKLWAGSKDMPVDKHVFIWENLTAIGNDKKCVLGTILDINDERSDIYATFKKFCTAVRCLKEKKEIPISCQKFCRGCAVFEKSKCVAAIKEARDSAFSETGDFVKIQEKIDLGVWKL